MQLRSQSRPKKLEEQQQNQKQKQQKQNQTHTAQPSTSLLDLPREVRDLIYEELVALPGSAPKLTTTKRASRSRKRKRRASDALPIDGDNDDNNNKTKGDTPSSSAIPAADEILYIQNHSNAHRNVDSVRFGSGQLTLSSCGWPALALMLSCKQVAAELRQLFWQPYRIGTAVAAWHCSISLGDLTTQKGGRGGGGSGVNGGVNGRRRSQKVRVPRFRWHVLSCHPAALRSLVVDVKISGKQFSVVSMGTGGIMNQLWTAVRRSGMRGYDTPGIRMRTLWDLLALVLYRGPRFDSARLLEEHVRLDDLTIHLVDDGVDTSRQLSPNIFNLYRIARHDACCHKLGHSRKMHEIFNSLASLIREGMRRGCFTDHVQHITCTLKRPEKTYTATCHSGETVIGRTGEQLMAKIEFLGLDWRTDRWLVPSSSVQI